MSEYYVDEEVAGSRSALFTADALDFDEVVEVIASIASRPSAEMTHWTRFDNKVFLSKGDLRRVTVGEDENEEVLYETVTKVLSKLNPSRHTRHITIFRRGGWIHRARDEADRVLTLRRETAAAEKAAAAAEAAAGNDPAPFSDYLD